MKWKRLSLIIVPAVLAILFAQYSVIQPAQRSEAATATSVQSGTAVIGAGSTFTTAPIAATTTTGASQ